MNNIIIFDTTLRDGEQAPGASMTIPEKMQIAHELARLGVDVIEAGFPVSSDVQFDGVKRIVGEVSGPTIAALARAKQLDIDRAAKALEGGDNVRIHTFIGTSDIHIEGKFGDERYGRTLSEKRKTVLQMAVEAVQQAKCFTNDVEFSAEDAGRTPVAYLKEIIAAVIEAGATTINVPDTTGFCLPNEYSELIASCISASPLPNIIFSTHCHNDLGMATANSLAGVHAGARQIECTINGIGERAGNAALEEIVMALRVRQNEFGLDSRINSRMLMGLSKLVSTYSSFPVQPNKAIVGKNAFSHEAGIHQDGILKRRDTYEIMRAEDVGQTNDNQIFLGRHSGKHALVKRLEQLGFSVSDEKKDDLYERFKKIADQKKHIYDEDLTFIMQAKDKDASTVYYDLDRLVVNIDTDRNKLEASVTIRFHRTGNVVTAKATGDGPVDAIYRAIEHIIEHAYELTGYEIKALSEGQDALGEVTVKIRAGSREFSGQASDMNTLKASALAYIDALNRIAAYNESQDFARSAIRGSGEMEHTV